MPPFSNRRCSAPKTVSCVACHSARQSGSLRSEYGRAAPTCRHTAPRPGRQTSQATVAGLRHRTSAMPDHSDHPLRQACRSQLACTGGRTASRRLREAPQQVFQRRPAFEAARTGVDGARSGAALVERDLSINRSVRRRRRRLVVRRMCSVPRLPSGNAFPPPGRRRHGAAMTARPGPRVTRAIAPWFRQRSFGQTGSPGQPKSAVTRPVQGVRPVPTLRVDQSLATGHAHTCKSGHDGSASSPSLARHDVPNAPSIISFIRGCVRLATCLKYRVSRVRSRLASGKGVWVSVCSSIVC